MTAKPTQQIPTFIGKDGTQRGEGFLTASADHVRQKVNFPPRRVIPIVFLPGIMGSNLRMSAARQAELKPRGFEQKNNISWRPDNSLGTADKFDDSPAQRQLCLDPEQTVVDIYEPQVSPPPTGNDKETADARHDNVKVEKRIEVPADSPILMDDPPTKPKNERRTAAQKALRRGWSEVYFGSYGQLLNLVEQRMNAAFVQGRLNAEWKDVVDVDPARWHAHGKLDKLTEAELKKIVTDCWYPVHAFGYNWLQSNGESAKKVAVRIDKMMNDYKADGFECEKVIVVTHSMGGLVARGLIHPKYGDMKDKVLGMVHGVMPAIGAAAAYKRIRSGFEEPGWTAPTANMVAKIAGNFGDEVTAVLANAPGGLELLPTESYGNGWLQIRYRGAVIKQLPENGNPYDEIYALQNKWYGLLPNEAWINPARLLGAGFRRTTKEYIPMAQKFHEAIANTYHEISFAHYGADPGMRVFQNVVWEIADRAQFKELDSLRIVANDRQGRMTMEAPERPSVGAPAAGGLRTPNEIAASQSARFACVLQPPVEAGDQTVPVLSADHQQQSGKFKGIFRQAGYDHQASYKNADALCSTLYSIAKIAKEMSWFKT